MYLKHLMKYGHTEMQPKMKLLNTYETMGMYFQVPDKLVKIISNAYEAAAYIALVGADNALENHINNALNSSSNFKIWRQNMPLVN